jgi:hypothetical protein
LAVDALIDLLGAEGSVRLGTARTLLEHALGRSRRALEFDRIPPSQVTRLVGSLVGAALDHMPDDGARKAYLTRAEGICRAA